MSKTIDRIIEESWQEEQDRVNEALRRHAEREREAERRENFRHSLLAWGIVLCCLAMVGIAVWFLNGVRFEW
jgi:ferric-dicitrate binding protein FerR (iron transport regulator)